MSIENESTISKIVEISIFKLQKNLEDIYLHVSSTEIMKAQQFFNENNERADRVII